ncbi:sugar phosphate isomerase/epimerase [candidate division KSB1 bacterium]|nr:sugar phosphate isomerase/epimerase [candidate division KSB1 bacterium]
MNEFSRRDFLLKSSCAGLLLALPATAENSLSQKKSQITGQKIAVFSKHLQWLDYRGMAETAAKIGFDGVDLTVRPKGHVLPEKVEDDLPKAAEACKKAGIEILMMSTAIDDAAHPTTEKILRTASQLGIKYYRMNWYRFDKSIGIDKNLENFKTKMIDLAGMNKQYGIKGGYQNHSGTWFGAPIWDLGMVLREINSEWLGCQYDIRHATVEGAQSWPVGLEYIAPYINMIDIKDFRWDHSDGDWELLDVPLGEGMVDFKQFFKLTGQFNIKAPLSIHFEYDLGGANLGLRVLKIPGEKVIDAMKKDLFTLKQYLNG